MLEIYHTLTVQDGANAQTAAPRRRRPARYGASSSADLSGLGARPHPDALRASTLPPAGEGVCRAPPAISCRTASGWSGCACRRTARGRRHPCPCSCPALVSSFPCCCASGLSPWRPPGWMIRKRSVQCSAFALLVPLPPVGRGRGGGREILLRR